MKLQSDNRHPITLIWAFARGGLIPIIALILSIALSLGLGVMAAEDWDGFAHRIDMGKTGAFYLSLLFGIWLSFRAIRQPQKRNRGAQALGLGLILLLWLILL